MKKTILALIALLLLTAFAAGVCEEAAVPVTRLGVSGGASKTITLNPGASAGVAVIILPRNATNKTLKWTSSNPDVASVDGGKITANAIGTCTVTCETTDGSALKDSLTVVVESEYAVTLEGVSVGHNSIGSPEVYVKVHNGGSSDVIAFTFATKCYDAYGNLLKAHGFGDTEKSWIWQEGRIKPGKTYSDNSWCWTLYGFDTAYRIDVWLTHYRTADGLTTTISPGDYHVFTWNKH
ncbi:MAG: Ig-like domain-containing protein [Clostridia bacterium]|nr:Ig-like domain-containing protein [Clostridia bacterium]